MERGFASLVIVMMLSLGPFVQAVDVDVPDQPLTEWKTSGTGFTMGGGKEVELLPDVQGHFTENLGQRSEGAGRFYCEGNPLSVAFGDGWVAYDFHPDDDGTGVMYRMVFEDSNPVVPVGVEPLFQKSNFFVGNNPERWFSGVCSYRKIVYPGIYDGIDLVFAFAEGRMKYEFHVVPGADPKDIRMSYDGIEGLDLDPSTGDLLIRTVEGTVRDDSPFTYQLSPTGVREVVSSYQLLEPCSHAFHVGSRDPSIPLVIDPGLEFSTFLGGTRDEDIHGILLDENDNILAAAQTDSAEFPTTPGAYDRHKDLISSCVVLKMSADGKKLLYSTFIGGNDQEIGNDVVLDGSGNIYMNGITRSTDFPMTAGAIQAARKGDYDLFFLILDPTGSRLLYSTYIGGSDWENAYSLVMDGVGDVYMAGTTRSPDFPVVAGGFNTTRYGSERAAFVLKINVSGKKLAYSTYLGGGDACMMTLDGSGCAYVRGHTGGGVPTTNNAYQRVIKGGDDAYVCKLSADGTKLLNSTYLGGSSDEEVWWGSIRLDSQGNPVISGYTYSDDFPTTSGAYDTTLEGSTDVFFTKLNASFESLIWSTYVGGSSSDIYPFFQLDTSDSIFFTISTASTDISTTQDAFCSTSKGNTDVYIGRLDSSGSDLIYGTYLGGSDSDSPRHIARGLENTTVVGLSRSSNFPTTVGAYDRGFNGQNDIFVVRLETGPPSVINGTVPTEPVNLTIGTGDRTVTLEWEPPVDDGNLSLRGYRIYHGLAQDSLSRIGTTLTTITSHRHNPLNLGVTNYYAVSAFNALGEGNLSEIASVVPYGTPSMPRNLQATAGCGTVNMTWSPPLDSGGLEVLGYHILRGTDAYNLTYLATVGNVTSFPDRGLENARTYYYSVMAFNAMGNSTSAVPVPAMPTGPPSAPWYLMTTPGNSLVDLTWRPPLSDGGSSILGFLVLRGYSTSNLEEHSTRLSHETTYRDLELENGRTYYYAVLAFNLVGNGPMSEVVGATPLGPPGVPQGLELEPGDAQVTVSWGAPALDGGTTVLHYTLYRGLEADGLEPLANVTGTTYNDTDVENGRTYYYSVLAVNKVGPGPGTLVQGATPMGLPTAPIYLVVKGDIGEIYLQWAPPLDAGGGVILGYVVYRGESPTSLSILQELGPLASSHVDLDCSVGRLYHYTVAAVNEMGEGDRCVPASAMAIGPPGVPRELSAVAGDGEVALTWLPPESDGASPITGYVLMRGASMASLRELARLDEVTEFLDASVSNDQTYLYVIAAMNAAGLGEYSDTVEATPFKPATEPGQVRTLVGDAKGRRVTLQWAAPVDDGGSPITGYVVLRGVSADTLEDAAEVSHEVTSYTDEGLQRGTTYFYTVYAKNDVGEGEPLTAIEVKVPKKSSDDGPGFGATVALMALVMLAVLMTRRRAQRDPRGKV